MKKPKPNSKESRKMMGLDIKNKPCDLEDISKAIKSEGERRRGKEKE